MGSGRELNLRVDAVGMGMQISLSTESLARVGSSEISFRRGNLLPVEVVFLSEGRATDLPAGSVGKLALKSTPDGTFLALSDSWTKAGIGASSAYVFDLNLNTEELAAALNTADSIRALMEIEWMVGDYRYSSNAIPVVIYESLIQGEAAAPIQIDLKANEQEAVEGTANNKWMTPLRTKQAVLQAISEIDAGVNGASAYELAVEAGFSGSVEEWLLSLVGEPGINGLSASVLNLPTDYDSFALTRTDGNITSVSYSKDGNEIGVAILTWDTTATPNRVATASDGTKTVTLIYDEAGQVTGGTIS
jgi:hypothetical protein